MRGFLLPNSTLIAAVAVLALPTPADAIVVWETQAAKNYRQCVERIADRDSVVRAELVKAVSRQMAADTYGMYTTARWKAVFEQRVTPTCGKAPKRSCDGEPPCWVDDNRPSVQIATDLVHIGSRVVRSNGRYIWMEAR